MATPRVAVAYFWELGIDWSAVETAGVSYLRGGLVQGDVLMSGTAPVGQDDTITFRIFDVSSSVQERQVATIDSFGVLTKAAVRLQSIGNPLSNLQPAIKEDTLQLASKCFPTAYASWTAQQVVSVSVSSGRFLLTVQLQATGPDGGVRIFRHDPEMIVGAST